MCSAHAITSQHATSGPPAPNGWYALVFLSVERQRETTNGSDNGCESIALLPTFSWPVKRVCAFQTTRPRDSVMGSCRRRSLNVASFVPMSQLHWRRLVLQPPTTHCMR